MSVQLAKKSKVIGLTGNIASGKSTALRYLKSKGYVTIDSDQIVSEIWNNEHHLNTLSSLFKRDLSNPLIKKQFSIDVFENESLKKQLESYMHPLVYKTIELDISKSHESIVIVDIPLLYETNYQDHVDAVILVVVDPQTQRHRLLTRGYSESHAQARIESQMPYALKMKHTNYQLNGALPLPLFYEALDEILRKLSV
jgi:dephospho-CoA kinase